MSRTIAGEQPPAALFHPQRLATTEALLEAQAAVAAVLATRATGPAGLDPATAQLLMRLSQAAECGIRGVEISARCQMTATRVSRLVDRAEADGLVARTPDPTDRRAQHVVLTAQGREAAERLAPLLDGALEELLFQTLSARERATLAELLGRLRDRAHEMLGTG